MYLFLLLLTSLKKSAIAQPLKPYKYFLFRWLDGSPVGFDLKSRRKFSFFIDFLNSFLTKK